MTRQRTYVIVPALVGLLLGLPACVAEEAEQELGDELAAELNHALPLLEDPDLLAFLDETGERLVAVSERPDQAYTFYIVDTGRVNAFALPGGHVYLSRALIERTGTFSELAGVMAHEIAHVAARHGARRLERKMRTGSVVRTLYQVILGGEPALLDNRALEIGGRIWMASHSRDDEIEADRLAVRYLVEAGVSPSGFITFMRKLAASGEDGAGGPEWFSTHPATEARVEKAIEKVRTLRAQTRVEEPLVQTTAEYQRFRSRLASYPPPAPVEVPLP